VRLIPVNGELYLLKGKVSVDTNFTTEELKKQYSADTVLRNNNKWYLVEKVIEAEWEDL
tara:strand:+ start:137 stop:313 length:177 start_codon:yes stop_codon:yes gene_type:complete